jgi:hypothetical protein
MLEFISQFLLSIACILYITRRYGEAKNRRDGEWVTRPAAGLDLSEKGKPSVFWYLFK